MIVLRSERILAIVSSISGAPISYVLHFKIPSISEAVRQEAICESSTRGSTGKGWLNLGDGTTGMAIMLPKREALWLTKP
ncbi:hypothetical protein HZH66_002958 [Vespula vulgaris]|uniref:Uncharacterized protein n=2 Tax=Vespula TaxID=7451 RepID=A0A834PC83_VESPE|nr:hypothetical protein HZH66_002958 [Vespula vulgaris]KAF7435445.1 hypothetical protein H0235_003636 [Vespula pensylvanica]